MESRFGIDHQGLDVAVGEQQRDAFFSVAGSTRDETRRFLPRCLVNAKSRLQIDPSASAQTLGSNTGVTTWDDSDVAKLRGANMSSLQSEAAIPPKYLQTAERSAMGSVGLEPTASCV